MRQATQPPAARNADAGDDADPDRPERSNPKRDDYPSPPAYGASTLFRPRAKPTAGPSPSPAGHATQPHSTGLLAGLVAVPKAWPRTCRCNDGIIRPAIAPKGRPHPPTRCPICLLPPIGTPPSPTRFLAAPCAALGVACRHVHNGTRTCGAGRNGRAAYRGWWSGLWMGRCGCR